MPTRDTFAFRRRWPSIRAPGESSSRGWERSESHTSHPKDAACHDAGRNFTDGLSHALDGLRHDETRREFDTPSLRFLDGTAPYFHDGRFPTVHDMLTDDRHHMGHAGGLTPNDLAALESYLHTL